MRTQYPLQGFAPLAVITEQAKTGRGGRMQADFSFPCVLFGKRHGLFHRTYKKVLRERGCCRRLLAERLPDALAGRRKEDDGFYSAAEQPRREVGKIEAAVRPSEQD